MRADLVAFVLSVISVRRVEGFDLPLVQNIFFFFLSNVGTEGGFFRDVIAGLFMTRFSCSHMSPDYITTPCGGWALVGLVFFRQALVVEPSASLLHMRLGC